MAQIISNPAGGGASGAIGMVIGAVVGTFLILFVSSVIYASKGTGKGIMWLFRNRPHWPRRTTTTTVPKQAAAPVQVQQPAKTKVEMPAVYLDKKWEARFDGCTLRQCRLGNKARIDLWYYPGQDCINRAVRFYRKAHIRKLGAHRNLGTLSGADLLAAERDAVAQVLKLLESVEAATSAKSTKVANPVLPADAPQQSVTPTESVAHSDAGDYQGESLSEAPPWLVDWNPADEEFRDAVPAEHTMSAQVPQEKPEKPVQTAPMRRNGVVTHIGRLIRSGMEKRTGVSVPYECFCITFDDAELASEVQVWGTDLERALAAANVVPGDVIQITQVGEKPTNKASPKKIWSIVKIGA